MMICLDPRPGETLDQYLGRALMTAKRNDTAVCAAWDDHVILVRPAMTATELTTAWTEFVSAP